MQFIGVLIEAPYKLRTWQILEQLRSVGGKSPKETFPILQFCCRPLPLVITIPYFYPLGGTILMLQCQDLKAGASRLAGSKQQRKCHRHILNKFLQTLRCDSKVFWVSIQLQPSEIHPSPIFNPFKCLKMIIIFLSPPAVKIAFYLVLCKSILPDTQVMALQQTDLQLLIQDKISIFPHAHYFFKI